MRAADDAGELSVPINELFSSTEILGAMAMERMLAGLSARRYPVGLEPVGEQVSATSLATSKSAVSRKFVAMTETALAELLAADLSELDLVALMVDGVHLGESCCVVALGIDSERSSTRWRWSRARPRTPPSSPTCWGFNTRAGTLEVAIPQLRAGSYFPDWLLERRRRAERR